MNSPLIKAAIIDDEMHCIKTLRYQIEQGFKNVEIVFTTTDSTEAKPLVDQHKPDIVFLDIEMRGIFVINNHPVKFVT